MARIGIFNSGVGGLTVQKAIFARLPGLDTVYLGDTARVPYGTKSPEVVTQYSLRNARVLVAQGIDLLVDHHRADLGGERGAKQLLDVAVEVLLLDGGPDTLHLLVDELAARVVAPLHDDHGVRGNWRVLLTLPRCRCF